MDPNLISMMSLHHTSYYSSCNWIDLVASRKSVPIGIKAHWCELPALPDKTETRSDHLDLDRISSVVRHVAGPSAALRTAGDSGT